MALPRSSISALVAGSPEHEVCALWRHEAFLKCGWVLRDAVTAHGYKLKLMDKDL